jgi:hypothetical protein
MNTPFVKPLFRLGQITATPGAAALLESTGTDVLDLLMRHVKGDFGDVSADDANANMAAVRHGGRILSSYRLGPVGECLWIITEQDRSATTLLQPSEY